MDRASVFNRVVMSWATPSAGMSAAAGPTPISRVNLVLLMSGVLMTTVSLPSAVQAHVVETMPAQTTPNTTMVAPNSGGVTTVRPDTPIITRQQVQLYPGISKATAGSSQLSMNRIVLPPGTKGLRHRHNGAETVIYVLEGEPRTLIGLNGETIADNKAGDFIFIPAGVWHQPMNISNSNVIAIEARADADDQSNVEVAPVQ
jgi:uncharacterized RmlC-like cupin family protein